MKYEQTVVSVNFTCEEVEKIAKKVCGEKYPIEPLILTQTTSIMNTLNAIYFMEEKDVPDEELFKQAFVFAYHINELITGLKKSSELY